MYVYQQKIWKLQDFGVDLVTCITWKLNLWLIWGCFRMLEKCEKAREIIWEPWHLLNFHGFKEILAW